MLYPVRWKKITVEQSKVLKIDCIDCSVFGGPPGIGCFACSLISRMRSDFKTINQVPIWFWTFLGTLEERGIIKWQRLSSDEGSGEVSPEVTRLVNQCYELPCCGPSLNKINFFGYLPFCPSFRGWDCPCGKQNGAISLSFFTSSVTYIIPYLPFRI